MARRVCLLTTLDLNLFYFYRDLIPRLISKGDEVWAVSSSGRAQQSIEDLGARSLSVTFEREPAPIKDLWALLKLILIFRRFRFDLIVLSTPKASLLGAIAARLVMRRSQVVYIVRGRAYENFAGRRRKIYVLLERLTCRLSDRILVISQSLRNALIEDRVAPSDKLHLFANGSSRGVDVERFSTSESSVSAGADFRATLDIPAHTILIGYVGWIRRDKGTEELIAAVQKLLATGRDVHLLLVGEHEEVRDPIDPALWSWAGESLKVHHVPWLADPSVAFNALDIFAFPSHREGFGNVALEAAACGLPIVASDAVGVRDAVEFGVTALGVRVASVPDLVLRLSELVDDQELRNRLGNAGRARVEADFDAKFVLSALDEALR